MNVRNVLLFAGWADVLINRSDTSFPQISFELITEDGVRFEMQQLARVGPESLREALSAHETHPVQTLASIHARETTRRDVEDDVRSASRDVRASGVAVRKCVSHH